MQDPLLLQPINLMEQSPSCENVTYFSVGQENSQRRDVLSDSNQL
jgi:hypothetical protein